MTRHRRSGNPDANKLIIFHNPTGSATFDPGLTTSASTTVIWQTEAGVTITTGTSHALSYTPTAGPKVCKVTVLAGLRAVTGIDCNTDVLTKIINISKCINCLSLTLYINYDLDLSLLDIPRKLVLTQQFQYNNRLHGPLASIPTGVTGLQIQNCPLVCGSVPDLPAQINTAFLQFDTSVTSGSIASLVAIRDLRIYSMGWSAAQNTTVLLSAWGARANYTYASGIALRIGAPTGTPGTEPPAAGESNADWSWNAGTSRHDPLTGYAAIADLQADYYDEGFKGWTVTIC